MSMIFNISIALVLVFAVAISWYVYSQTDSNIFCGASGTGYDFAPSEVTVPYRFMFWLSLLLTVLLVVYVVGIYMRSVYNKMLTEAINKKQKQIQKRKQFKR